MRPSRSVRHVGVALLLGPSIMAGFACASVPRRPAAAVVPGLALQVHTPVHPDTIVFQRSTSRAGQDSSTGTRTVVLTPITSSTALLQVEQRFPGGGGEIVDTAVAELGTWRAVAHESHQPKRIMRFAFAGDAAEGSVLFHTGSGDSSVAVHQALGGPLFDSNVIDLVVAALPLRLGFSADLPFFFYERGGRVMMRVSVRERATVSFAKLGTRDVWIVNVAVPGAPATMWVDAKTHVPLRVRYELPTVSFTDERITPLT